MKYLFDESSQKVSQLITNTYSTSFSLGIKLLSPCIRRQIYSIYGFVRYADEIVDSFHDFNQEKLLNEFENEYKLALKRKISLNPILNSFSSVVLKYRLEDLVVSFLKSMRMDLHKSYYNTEQEYEEYIYGSADVVGLMCLRVFVKGDEGEYERLKPYAMSLGSAFQKVNFLRDFRNDTEELGRSYFPNVDLLNLNLETKSEIISDIKSDFKHAFEGIKKLPMECRLGVYVAYRYYLKLLNKLEKKHSDEIAKQRIRVPNSMKAVLLLKSYLRYKFNLL